MHAALGLERGHRMSVEDVEVQPIGPHDVVVAIGASGVCHTDIAALTGALPAALPFIGGHEGAGVVEEIGPAVASVKVGDRVIGNVGPVCGTCWFCRGGMSHLCENAQQFMGAPRVARADGTLVAGFSGLGTFAETMISHEASLVRVETDLPDEQLALIGCAVTTGLGAVFNTAKVTPGASVAVVGCGGVGQSVIQGARVAGAGRIIAIDPGANKREASIASGATDAVDPTQDDAGEAVRKLTGGRGADFTFEVVGKPETIVSAFELARRGGTVTVVGMPAADATLTLPAFMLAYGDKRLCASYYGGTQAQRDFPLIIGLAETGRIDLDAMVTRRLALADVNDAIRALEAGEEIRSVVRRDGH